MIHAFGDYELDHDRFELRRGGQRVPLEPQVFEVLAFLVANHDRAVSKDELIGHVWPERFISDAALNSRVMAARKAIGDNGKDQALIRTIHGRGYRFVGEVAERLQVVPGPSAVDEGDDVSGASPAAVASTPVGVDVPITTFVGRESEIARLDRLLARPACRLVTIVGPGGVGKTRLAVEAARRLAGRGESVVSVPVQTIVTVSDLILAIGTHAGLTLATGDPAELAARLGGRPLLLLLDNLEHLVREAAPALAAMLQAAPGLRVMATSREVIGLPEEWLFPVGGLAHESGNGGVSEAERLFLAREAQALGGDAPPADDDVREICRLVDGMPLAIELAAALRRYLTRPDIARQIADDIDFLQADLRNVPARHRSIPGLLEESFRRLTVEQMRALLSLAVFEGSFAESASAAVAQAPLRVLSELVDRSLVAPREGRFALHPLLAQFARDRLGPALPEMQERHAEYYLELLASQREALEGRDQVGAVTRIEADWPNFAAGWRFACANQRFDLLAPAAYPLYLTAHLRARWLIVRPEIALALDAVGAAPEQWRLRAELFVYSAWVLIRTTRSAEIQRLNRAAEDTLHEHQALPSPGIGTDPVAIKSLIAWADGRYDRAADHARRSAERARAAGDRPGLAFALWLVAVSRLRSVELAWAPLPARGAGTYRPASAESVEILRRASEALDEASGILVDAGDTWLLAFVRIEQATVAKCLGDRAAARQHALEAHELRRRLDDARGLADAQLFLADLALDVGDANSAVQAATAAELHIQKLGDLGTEAELLRVLARVDWLRRDFQGALARLRECGELSIQVNAANNVIAVLRATGDVLIDLDDPAAGAELHAFVAEHPASTAFSRALSNGVLAGLEPVLGAEALAQARARVRGYQLIAFLRSVFDALDQGAALA